MTEGWRAVQGYEGLYEVSDLGRVRSLERDAYRRDGARLRLKAAMKKLTVNGAGYVHVRLTKQGASSNVLVHRMVAEAFIPNPDGLPFVNHIDLDTTRNLAANLEWLTHKSNIIHARDGGRLNGGTNANRRFKLNPHSVSEIRKRCGLGERHSVVAREHGVGRRMIGHINGGTRWPSAFDPQQDSDVNHAPDQDR